MSNPNAPSQKPVAAASDQAPSETPFEAIASICSVLVIGLFILTILGQNFAIPSGSMKNTLLVGDHLFVDRITLAPPGFPLVHYREPQRNDVVVFHKPVLSANGEYMILVKRLIGVPGDRIHLRNGIVFINGVAQDPPYATPIAPEDHRDFLDEFPSVPPTETEGDPNLGTPEAWAVDFPNHIENGDLVVPPGMYFMMGDNRHNSLDSRYWGFVPRQNLIGRPVFNYWSFKTPDDQMYKTNPGDQIAWMAHVVLHFFTDTRWARTFHRVN
jgi:signal peptidase I